MAAVFIGFIPGCGGEDPSLIPLGASGVPVGPESPCGPSVSLNHAKDAVSFVLLLPDHDIASEETIDGVYVCSRSVLIRFQTGVDLVEEPEAPADPAALISQIAAEDPQFRMGDIRGIPALLIEPSADTPNITLGGVTLFRNGLLVDLAGDGHIPLDQLIEVAESLHPEGQQNS